MKEALKLALDVLESDYVFEWPAMQRPERVKKKRFEAITAIKEALAPTSTQCEVQPEQEVDWKDQYEKQKRRAEMWLAKYEEVAGPAPCAVPLAQPEQSWSWVCNECGSREFTSAVLEADLEYLACAGCGCNEFHKEALAQPDYRAVKTYHEGKPVYVSQPEQEPVAWEQFYPDIGKPQLGQEPVAIYRAGQAKGEGFHVEFLKEMGDDEVLLYTTPPQRPWVGLTDEKRDEILDIYLTAEGRARAIEAELKELNT